MTVSGQLAALGSSGSALATNSAPCVRNEAQPGRWRRTTDDRSLDDGRGCAPKGCEVLERGNARVAARRRHWAGERPESISALYGRTRAWQAADRRGELARTMASAVCVMFSAAPVRVVCSGSGRSHDSRPSR
jgi:hypothetical protein